MLTKKAKITGFLMTMLLAVSAPLVYADNGNGGQSSWERHGDHHRGGFFKDLTDDQKKQLKGIWQKQKEARKAAFEQIKTNRDALTNELLQTTPDVNKINDLKSKLEATGTQMLDSRINLDLEVKKILTAEQFAKYLEFQKHRKYCKHHRHHQHHDDND